jgi:thioredoxin reductase
MPLGLGLGTFADMDTTTATTTDPIETDWDVIIVGRSFAGLSAALTLGRARRSVLVVGTGGPRNEAVGHAHGMLSRDHESPTAIIAVAEAQLARYPNIGLVDDRVLAIEPIGPGAGFRATVGRRTTTATGVVLANGVNDDPMPIPGVAEHWGRGVFTCPFCDGWEHRDLHLAVIGDPAFAPHTGQLLTGWSDRVTVFCDLDADVVERLAGFGVAVDDRPVARVLGDGAAVSGIELEDGTVVAVGAVFHARLPVPNTPLAVSLGCELAPMGFVVTDEMQRTTVDGVWAAGDLTGMRHQMSFAIADGAAAASSLVAYLMGTLPPS